MIIPVLLENEEVIHRYLQEVKERSDAFVLSLFHTDLSKFILSEGRLLVILRVKMNIPPFYMSGLVLIVLSMFFDVFWLFWVGVVLSVPVFMYMHPPYYWAFYRGLRKKGYSKKMKMIDVSDALEFLLPR